jgi:hypothetical protein
MVTEGSRWERMGVCNEGDQGSQKALQPRSKSAVMLMKRCILNITSHTYIFITF